MGNLVLSGATSGSITLEPTAVAGTTTLTLPAANGTILTTGSSGQSIPKAALPTGSVLQVVNADYGSYTSTTSTSPVDLGLTASMTPTSASSKVLVFVSINGVERNTSSSGPIARFQLLRNSSTIFNFENSIFAGSSTTGFANSSTSYLDSPSTTSATTYKIQWNISNNTGTLWINNYASGGQGTTRCTITLMEIAA